MDGKKCTKCNEYKKLDEFYTQKRTCPEKGDFLYYRPDCKECTRSSAREWAEDNPRKVKASRIKYNKSPNGRKLALINARRRIENGEYAKWQKKNKERLREYGKKRQMKNHNISNQEWEECKAYFNYSCAYCGMSEKDHKKINKQQLHKEHVIHEGRDDIKNCVPSCRTCNSSKNVSPLNAWYNKSNPDFTRERYLRIYQWIRYDCRRIVAE